MVSITVAALLREITAQLAQAGCDAPAFDARCLLEDIGGVGRGMVDARAAQPLPPDAVQAVRRAADRRAAGYPLQYLLGEWDFLTLTLQVGEGVLIPRADTEVLCEHAAAWLQEMHLLDDAQYAAMCVRHYAAKGYGAGRIRSELYRRGIPREAWDDALQELPEQDEQIDALLRRRLRSDTPDRDELRRASDYLYRRGFGRDEIRAAIARYQDNFEEY